MLFFHLVNKHGPSKVYTPTLFCYYIILYFIIDVCICHHGCLKDVPGMVFFCCCFVDMWFANCNITGEHLKIFNWAGGLIKKIKFKKFSSAILKIVMYAIILTSLTSMIFFFFFLLVYKNVTYLFFNWDSLYRTDDGFLSEKLLLIILK